MDPYLSQIQVFGCNFAPRGWATCEGQLLAIAQNTALFSLLGTTYGGDGRTTFGLPDLRGRSMIGQGNGPGLASQRWGQEGGTESFTLTNLNLPSHNHVTTIGVSTGQGSESSATSYIASHAGGFSEEATSGANLAGVTTANTGSQQAVNKRSPYLALYICIAMVGVFPSRN